jgi:hypothetical protein
VADRRAFLLRIDPELHDALQRWAADELRSLNGQIEFVLRREAAEAGRLKARGDRGERGDRGDKG